MMPRVMNRALWIRFQKKISYNRYQSRNYDRGLITCTWKNLPDSSLHPSDQ